MAAIYSPLDKGFDDRFAAIDRCQVALLRELAAQHGQRLVLKGGMAMRAAFGSTRLTKDIDFDRDATISQASLESGLKRNLLLAATTSVLREVDVAITKSTGTTVRARLQGRSSSGQDVRFEVEVSGRGAPAPGLVRTEMVVPPAAYSMAPFPVVTYRNEALAAMKVSAVLSESRNAPRDLYDLRDLVRAGVDPHEILARQDPQLLGDFVDRVFGKMEMLTYEHAQQELLPFLPLQERVALTEEAWLDAALLVAESIQGWCGRALTLRETSAAEHDRGDPVGVSAPRKPR